MTRRQKIFAGFCGSLFLLSIIAAIFFWSQTLYNDRAFSSLSSDRDTNHVQIHSDVRIAAPSDGLQADFKGVTRDGTSYTVSYAHAIPDFFKALSVGDRFLVYPNPQAEESFFSLGFCGQVEGIDNSSVRFSIPPLQDIFSELYICTDGQLSRSAVFHPAANVSCSNTLSSPATAYSSQVSDNPKLSVSDSIAYRYKQPSTSSLLEDYILLGDELSLRFDCSVQDETDFSFRAKGTVDLEGIAVKCLLDYRYNKSTNTVDVRDYALGFTAKHRVDMTLSAEKEADLTEPFGIDMQNDRHILDIVDVTESEKGKIVLGTYLIGLEADLPLLENEVNRVSRLSLGVAVQLSVTASGKLALEYDMESSGFSRIEVNSNNDCHYLSKGYAYPNPVTDSREPNQNELLSKPAITAEISGSAQFDLAVGADIGICILGLIPIKQTIRLVEADIAGTFSDASEKELADVTKNGYLTDQSATRLICSTSSHLKLHLGANINLGPLSYSIGQADGSIQLFKNVWYQYPPPQGFTHDQCDFGGICLGETYTEQELNDAFQEYLNSTDNNGILTQLADSLAGSLINTAINDWHWDLLSLLQQFGFDPDEYHFQYYASGVVYIRDAQNTVVAAIIIGDTVTNRIGIAPGLTYRTVENVYSVPDFIAAFDLRIGTLAKSILGLDGIDDSNWSIRSYSSKNSTDQMHLICIDEDIKLIFLTSL